MVKSCSSSSLVVWKSNSRVAQLDTKHWGGIASTTTCTEVLSESRARSAADAVKTGSAAEDGPQIYAPGLACNSTTILAG